MYTHTCISYTLVPTTAGKAQTIITTINVKKVKAADDKRELIVFPCSWVRRWILLFLLLGLKAFALVKGLQPS